MSDVAYLSDTGINNAMGNAICTGMDTEFEADLLEAAKNLYPQFSTTENPILRKQYAVTLANLLGTPGEFQKYIFGNAGDLEQRRQSLMRFFHDNVALLLSKTWIEDHDVAKKEEAVQELDNLIAEIARGEYDRALVHLVNICDMVARLLFGEDPANSDFMDYVLRIDPKLGLFYWYIDQLRHPGLQLPSDELANLQLLIAVYALANY